MHHVAAPWKRDELTLFRDLVFALRRATSDRGLAQPDALVGVVNAVGRCERLRVALASLARLARLARQLLAEPCGERAQTLDFDRDFRFARAQRLELLVAQPGNVALPADVFARQAQLLFHLSLSLHASCVGGYKWGRFDEFQYLKFFS